MDHLYRISQPTGLMGFSHRPRQGHGEDASHGAPRSRTGESRDGTDFASVLARMMAR